MTQWRKWEDHQAGLYRHDGIDPDMVQRSLALLTDADAFYEAGREMIRAWRNAAQHNLIYLAFGRRAWIGQATCCYVHGASSAETRAAWGQMTNGEQRSANHTADVLMEQYERGRIGAETLFDN